VQTLPEANKHVRTPLMKNRDLSVAEMTERLNAGRRRVREEWERRQALTAGTQALNAGTHTAAGTAGGLRTERGARIKTAGAMKAE
jgi:hypothetical protein